MAHYKKSKAGGRMTNKSSSTRGKDKGFNCQATRFDRVYCTRNRSWKYPGYREWLVKTRITARG